MHDLLARRRVEEPEEVAIIKEFVREQLRSEVNVAITTQNIIIGARGAALAGALRPYLHNLQQLCATDKRLIIRIQ